MKAIIALSILTITASGIAWAQTSFSYGEEIIYPTEFDIKQNNNTNTNNGGGAGNTNVSNLPTVEPGGFETRKTGTSVDVKGIAVTGVVRVTRGANGKQIAVLKPHNGTPIKVATGSLFKLNGHVLRAVGMRGDNYLVYDVNTRRTFVFTQP